MTVRWDRLAFTLAFDSSPIKETFAKLSGTTIMCLDSQSSKLGFPIDSRLRGNDGRFCKGLHQGRGGLVVGVGLFTRVTRRPVDCGSSPQ